LRTRQTRSRQGSRGFTLVELLVVLVILGLIAAIATPQVIKYLGRANSDAARIQVERLAGILDLYRLEPEDTYAVGIEEELASEGVKVVEWAERLPATPPGAIELTMKRTGRAGEREILESGTR